MNLVVKAILTFKEFERVFVNHFPVLVVLHHGVVQRLNVTARAECPPAVAACKGLIQQARSGSINAAYATERGAFVKLFDTQDQKEGVNAFLEKRSPEWING